MAVQPSQLKSGSHYWSRTYGVLLEYVADTPQGDHRFYWEDIDNHRQQKWDDEGVHEACLTPVHGSLAAHVVSLYQRKSPAGCDLSACKRNCRRPELEVEAEKLNWLGGELNG